MKTDKTTEFIVQNSNTHKHFISIEEFKKWAKDKMPNFGDNILDQMNKEKIDYLCCNYSKEEIAKLGQCFGDINLKNGW
jgi:hypothetical protein